MHNPLPPRPEHIEGVINAISDGKLHSPKWIATKANLTLTAVKGALTYLERTKKLRVARQERSPKLLVALKRLSLAKRSLR